MEPLYKPEGVEERWQRTWEEEGHYNADPDPSRESFAIAHPPPNVTGDLHLGHALQLSLADTIVRTRRMQGYNTLFQPGFDHAGISTQNAVEKHLATKERRARTSGARRSCSASGSGCASTAARSCSSSGVPARRSTTGASASRWTRPTCAPVMRFFVHLYDKGWIYRANRIINWCPFHLTSLSDLELAHVDVDDMLTYVRYPLADGDGHITIATVRPATILADVAVAVHPEGRALSGDSSGAK
jgi:valyl-tRNA synthetase